MRIAFGNRSNGDGDERQNGSENVTRIVCENEIRCGSLSANESPILSLELTS